MSTRSLIAYQHDDRFTGVYCHSDGYPAWTGRILNRHFKDPDKIARLTSADLSGLSTQGEPQYCDTNDCGRITEPLADLRSIATDLGAEYIYLWRDDAWWVAKYDGDWQGRWTGAEPLELLRPKICPAWPPGAPFTDLNNREPSDHAPR